MKTPYTQFDSNSQAGSEAEAEAVAGTGHSSAPACTPRTVIRGESLVVHHSADQTLPLDGIHPTAAITDWLNCTFPLPEHPKNINEFFQDFLSVVGPDFAPTIETGKGLHGWKRSFSFGKTSGQFGIGGQNGKVLLSLPGSACTLIATDSWPTLISVLRDHYGAKITRWDGAVDDFEGSHPVDWAVEQYLNDQFNSGGNRPSCDQRGNWIIPDGKGRTFYVGMRENGKTIRIYEKGKQLGDPTSPWVRWELELHNKDREIPWDVLLNPGGYVANAYPCTAWIKANPAARIKTTQNTLDISYDVLTHYARLGYGRHLNVMLKIEGSAERVLERLMRPGIPARLDIPYPPEMLTKKTNEDVR